MNRTGERWKIAYILVVLLVLCVVGGGVTYAWFSSNSIVETDRVNARTGTDEIVLYVSAKGEGEFQKLSQVSPVQVNQIKEGRLMPVSTADLTNFVYNDAMENMVATSYERDAREIYIYHGRVYLKAESTDAQEKRKLALYFDGKEASEMFPSAKEEVRKAARLGLTLNGGTPRIFRLEEGHVGDAQANTTLNGEKLSENQVIDSSKEPFRGVEDPSVPMNGYLVEGAEQPTPIYILECNKVYTLDIYFYLEGCDPDCVTSLERTQVDMSLGFYGAVTTEDSQ